MKLLLKIFLLVSLVSIIFLSLFTDYVNSLNKDKQTVRLDEKISTYNTNYKNIVTKLLFDFNKEMIEITLDSLVLDPEVYDVKLKDYSGEINYEAKNKIEALEIYKTSSLLLVADKIKLGELIITYSNDQINAQSEVFIEQLFKTAVLFAILLVIVLYALIYYFLKRLKILAQASEELASGNLDYEIKIKSNDEIGQVSEKFEIMRKKLKERITLFNEQLKFRQLLINAINIPIYIKDKNLEFITCNNAYFELVGSNKMESLSVENLELNNEFIKIESKVFEDKKDLSKNLTISNSDGESIDIVLSNNLFYDNENNLAGLVGSVFDITQINKAKKRIERFNNELQVRVNEQTEELTLSNHELEGSLKKLKLAQNELIEVEKMASLGGLVAGIAHEINTPIGIGLTGITHFDEMLNEINEKYSSEEMTEEDFDEFLKSSKTLSNLIKLNLSRTAELVKSFKQISVDQSSEQKREFNIKEYLYEIITSLNAEIKKTKLKISISCPENISINSYPGVYSQIVTNLILNSINHAYNGGEEGLLILSVVEEDAHIQLNYSDDGKGIEEKNLSKIFDPFFTTNRKNGGSGLGLNVIYNLVTTKLAGTIVCESKIGEGVNFKIKIPYKK